MRLAIWLLVAMGLCAGIYAAIVAFFYTQQRSMLYPGANATAVDPALPAPWGQRVNVSTSDGETLMGLYVEPSPGRPVILFFHGNGDNILHYRFLADGLIESGLGLLAVSFRGYPGSTGSPTEAGLLVDGLASFDWLAAKGAPIVILGRSLGSGVAVATAANRDAAGLVLVSPYDSIAGVAAEKFPWLPVRWLIKDSFKSDERIGDVAEPKLFIHGEQDEIIAFARGKRLFDMAAGPKSFEALPGIGHNEVWTARTISLIRAFADQFAP